MYSQRNYTYIISLFCWFSTSLVAQTKLENQIKEIINTLPNSTSVSIFILNPTNGDTLYAKDINKPMIPASNVKLLTSSAALSILGKDYNLSVKLLTNDPNLTDGIINGNLYLKGFGNPKFSAKDIDNFINTLISLGVKEITGDIICDDSYFDTNFSHGTVYIEGKTNLSVPPVSAISFERNTIFLSVLTSEKAGSVLDYTYSPVFSFITMNMSARVTKFKSFPRVSYRFAGDEIIIRVSGGMHEKRKRNNYLLYIENPALYCALVFKEKLKSSGIKLTSSAKTGRTPINANEIVAAITTVEDILQDINKNSDNFYAESLYKSIGAKYSNEVGNSYFASLAIIKFLEEKNILVNPVKIADGSGISRSNTVSVNLLVNLLSYIYNNENLYTDFLNSLSIAGVDGTLKERMIGTYAQNNFRGKTGTIYGISAVSGYLKTTDNKTLVISIMMSYSEKGNQYHKSIEDKIIEIVCGQK